MEGLRAFIVGTVAGAPDHLKLQVGPQPAALVGHIEGHQPVDLPPHEQKGNSEAAQQGRGGRAMGP